MGSCCQANAAHPEVNTEQSLTVSLQGVNKLLRVVKTPVAKPHLQVEFGKNIRRFMMNK